MGRSPCCDESVMKKGPWTPEEDQKLLHHIQTHGHGSWRALPKLASLNRCGKSCRLRWTNYLRPDIKRGKFSHDEEQTILNLHSVLGNKWSAIATHLPGRTDNEIKNFWNTHLKKKLIQMGFDPMTHQPRTDIFASLSNLMALANLNELMAHHSWEEVAGRLQTEAIQLASLQYYMEYLVKPDHPQNNISNMNNGNELVQGPLFEAQMMDKEMVVLSEGENNCGSVMPTCSSSSWLPSLSSLELPSPSVAPSLMMDASSASSSNGGTNNQSFWHELFLDDPFFQDIQP